VVEVNENIAFIGLHVSPAHAYYKNQPKIALNFWGYQICIYDTI
jgi:hypothetical protein